MKKRSLKFFICFLVSIFIGFNCLMLFNVIMDPYFHYHAPNNNYYLLKNQRYINDGILKHFEYDSLIIGTSMCENFKTSEFDSLFNANSIKTCFSGAGYKEINSNIKTALENNKNLKRVVRCLDYNLLLANEDHSRYNSYPTYLYDNNIFNDYKYLLDKSVTKESIKNLKRILTKENVENSFDNYSYWNDYYTFGKESVLKTYKRGLQKTNKGGLSKQEIESVKLTITNNVLDSVNKNKEVEFYIFLSPYSIVYWDEINRNGNIDKYLEAEKIVIEMLLECENVKLFSFNTNFEMICDLNNYKDAGHYSAQVNSQILKWIKNNEYLLTNENYQEYLNSSSTFFKNYDYNSIFK